MVWFIVGIWFILRVVRQLWLRLLRLHRQSLFLCQQGGLKFEKSKTNNMKQFKKKNGAMSDSINAHKILQPGDRFGHWTVLGYIGLRKASSNARNRLRMYRCRCDCGRERDVRGTDLTRGVSPSCGCRRWEGRREIRDERFNAVTNRVPKPYVPEHPELFTDDWMFGDRQAPFA